MRYPQTGSRPIKGSSRYRRHYEVAYSLVLVAYFSYCVGQTLYDMPKNYYSRIGVQRLRVDEDLKSCFKTLVRQYHPDKAPNSDPQVFLEIKQAYEILDSEKLRVAYEIFGESVIIDYSQSSLKSKNIKSASLHDFFDSAFLSWSIYNLGSLGILIFLYITSSNPGNFWRILGLSLCATVELYSITRPAYVLTIDRSIKVYGYQRFLGAFSVNEKMKIFKCIIINLSIVLTQFLSLKNPPSKTQNQEITEISRRIHDLATGPLKDIGQRSTREVRMFAKDDESMQQNLKNAIGKVMNQIEAD